MQRMSRRRRQDFRNEWIMVRQQYPSVPSAEGTLLPHTRMSKEQRATLYNIYMRPWTLCAQHIIPQHVPHLRDIDLLIVAAPLDTPASGEGPTSDSAERRHCRPRYRTKQSQHPADDRRAPEEAATLGSRTHWFPSHGGRLSPGVLIGWLREYRPLGRTQSCAVG
jgi:hypothetical protein